MKFRISLAAICAALVFAVAGSGSADAHSVKVGTLELTDLWTRATPPNAPTAGGYLTVENKGTDPDRLVEAASPTAGLVELHEMSMSGGTMIMRPLADGIEIAPGAKVTLAPGGLHIMFMELKEPFKEGGKVPVELVFEKAGKIETFLHVMAIGAGGPEGDHGGHGDAAKGGTQ